MLLIMIPRIIFECGRQFLFQSSWILNFDANRGLTYDQIIFWQPKEMRDFSFLHLFLVIFSYESLSNVPWDGSLFIWTPFKVLCKGLFATQISKYVKNLSVWLNGITVTFLKNGEYCKIWLTLWLYLDRRWWTLHEKTAFYIALILCFYLFEFELCHEDNFCFLFGIFAA